MPYAHSFRTLFLAAAAAALVAGGPAIAQPGSPSQPVAEQSPFLGEWQLDLTRMPDTYGPPPKRVTFTFKDVGAGQWRTEVDITAPDDSVRHMAAQYRRDGKAVPGEGDTSEADSVAVNAPVPNVLVMSLSKNKVLGSVRVYAISADGREMTESATNVDNTGAPFVRNFHFKRVR
ncbi:hypothetical protein [Sphingomonas sp. Root241]|uniref:hypothetical protein n=1 Tax=Sphingomonas sp. Root241 TaxID=1736501 RepID=UPI000AEE12B9|nr:hypothetical protein [Sphingomonas sp. Root241]